MTLHADSPALLLALLVAPAFVLTARGMRAAGWCRALAAAALVLVVANVSLERARPARGACVIAAVDVSASVGDAARGRARDLLARLLPALDANDLVGTVAFAAHTHVVAPPAPRPRTVEALLPAGPPDPDEAGETDLATAVATASALCPAGKQAAVLLVTDGNETSGSVLAGSALGDATVPVFPVVPDAALPPVVLRRLLVPALAPAGSLVPVSAVVEARAAVTAAVAVAIDGQTTPPQPVSLAEGTNVVTVPYRVSGPGDHRVEARILAPPVPGAARAALTVTAPVRALVVSERTDPPVVARALVHQGIDVDVVAPAAFAARAHDLAGWHAVVLDDVAQAGLPRDALDALAAWVAGGGALVVSGGPHLFGDPGFVDGPLARVLPVALVSQTPEPEERDPFALYLLIDRSNSMAEVSAQGVAKIDFARRAALAVLDQLGPQDLVGAIAFDAEAYELGPLGPADETRPALTDAIHRLRPGGGTDFLDALAQAGRALVAAGPAIRHVILLTDGDTNRHPEDHEAVLADLRAAHVSVTTIRIGTDTVNLELLHTIARSTGGEFHHVTDMEALPQLMIRDTQRRMDEAAGRQDARVRLVDPGDVLAGLAERDVPPVARWAVTTARPGAEVRAVIAGARREDPLVVTWQYELGRVAVVPLDFQAGAAGWAAWPGFAPFVAQLVRWAAPRGLAGDRHVELRRVPAGTEIRVDTVADTLGPLVVPLPTGDVTVRQRWRRRFSAIVPAQLAPLDTTRETRATAPATALLETLAKTTGGKMDPTPRALLAARHGVTRDSLPLTGMLVPFAIVCLLVDIALRRPARS